MSKGLIAFLVVAVVGIAAMLIVEIKSSADQSRKRSDEIMQEFKAVDKSLEKINDSILKENELMKAKFEKDVKDH